MPLDDKIQQAIQRGNDSTGDSQIPDTAGQDRQDLSTAELSAQKDLNNDLSDNSTEHSKRTSDGQNSDKTNDGNPPIGQNPEEADFKAHAKEWIEAHPELEDYAAMVEKGMRKAYLEKTRELSAQAEEIKQKSELIKQVENTPPELVQHANIIGQSLRVDPTGRQAGMMLFPVVKDLLGEETIRQMLGTAPQPQGDSTELDNEVLYDLYPQLRERDKKFEEAMAYIREQQNKAWNQGLENDFNDLEKKFERSIPQNVRQEVYNFAQDNKFPSVEAAYKYLFYDELVQEAKDREREATLRSKMQKQNAPPNPNPLPSKAPAPEPDKPPKGLEAKIQYAINKHR